MCTMATFVTTTTMKNITLITTLLLALVSVEASFVPTRSHDARRLTTRQYATTEQQQERNSQKKALLQLLGRRSAQTDPVLADPFTKEPIQIVASGAVLGGASYAVNNKIKYDMRSSTNQYRGSSDTFLNLLEPVVAEKESASSSSSWDDINQAVVKPFSVLVPPPLRSALAGAMSQDSDYIPMRDLFTSPAVSFAYERGWRQGFVQAGFPGPDVEYQMARDYFAPVIANSNIHNSSSATTVVDMSCATGLFTRRFAKSGEYDRVLGCDYSESMLTEARRRIRTDESLRQLKRTQLDLVRLDVGKIPMQDSSVEALHAGAAMHCWPELERAATEIYRVLKPGGRYFATTFLSSYFATLQAADGGMANANGPSSMAFQYFQSVEQLRKLMISGGFEADKIQIEVLGAACVVIRCEK